MIQIRKATRKDVNDLVKLDRLANKEKKWWTPQTKRKFIEVINKKSIIILQNNKEIMGYLQSRLNKKTQSITIESIYVAVSFRRSGAAKKLIHYLIRSWHNKIKIFELITSDENMKVFKKLGFKKTANFMRLKR
jgi:N-acetylglutamate synthase-like GNAT family acetyltransferase